MNANLGRCSRFGSDDETDDDRKLPATSMPPRKLSKSPPMKSPPSKAMPIGQRKKDPSEGDVGALANALKGIIITQKDGTIGIIDVTQAYDYIVFVAKCERNVNYAHVRLQLPSDITSKMITCKVAEDGLSVAVTVRKPIDCALIDPMFTLMKYHAEGNVDQTHPIVVSLASLRRSHIESEKEEYTEKVVNVRLPFVCDKSGFYDPASFVSDHEAGINLGIYPISVEKHLDGIPIAEGAPHPNTNLLTFACKELHEEKVIQKVKAMSFMNLVEPTTARASATAPTVPHVEDI
jgi:hypothetical protein